MQQESDQLWKKIFIRSIMMPRQLPLNLQIQVIDLLYQVTRGELIFPIRNLGCKFSVWPLNELVNEISLNKKGHNDTTILTSTLTCLKCQQATDQKVEHIIKDFYFDKKLNFAIKAAKIHYMKLYEFQKEKYTGLSEKTLKSVSEQQFKKYRRHFKYSKIYLHPSGKVQFESAEKISKQLIISNLDKTQYNPFAHHQNNQKIAGLKLTQQFIYEKVGIPFERGLQETKHCFSQELREQLKNNMNNILKESIKIQTGSEEVNMLPEQKQNDYCACLTVRQANSSHKIIDIVNYYPSTNTLQIYSIVNINQNKIIQKLRQFQNELKSEHSNYYKNQNQEKQSIQKIIQKLKRQKQFAFINNLIYQKCVPGNVKMVKIKDSVILITSEYTFVLKFSHKQPKRTISKLTKRQLTIKLNQVNEENSKNIQLSHSLPINLNYFRQQFYVKFPQQMEYYFTPKANIEQFLLYAKRQSVVLFGGVVQGLYNQKIFQFEKNSQQTKLNVRPQQMKSFRWTQKSDKFILNEKGHIILAEDNQIFLCGGYSEDFSSKNYKMQKCIKLVSLQDFKIGQEWKLQIAPQERKMIFLKMRPWSYLQIDLNDYFPPFQINLKTKQSKPTAINNNFIKQLIKIGNIRASLSTFEPSCHITYNQLTYYLLPDSSSNIYYIVYGCETQWNIQRISLQYDTGMMFIAAQDY